MRKLALICMIIFLFNSCSVYINYSYKKEVNTKRGNKVKNIDTKIGIDNE